MRARAWLLLGGLAGGLALGVLDQSATAKTPAKKAAAKAAAPPGAHGGSGSCPLHCPAGLDVLAYAWEVHPERTVYDDSGKPLIPPESAWLVTCYLRCEHHEVGKETKEWKSDKKTVCTSGGEPGPFSGPWRITSQFTRECDSRESNGCGMRCRPLRAPKPPKKGGKK